MKKITLQNSIFLSFNNLIVIQKMQFLKTFLNLNYIFFKKNFQVPNFQKKFPKIVDKNI